MRPSIPLEIEQRLFELARQLIPATQAGKIDWVGTLNETRFKCSLGKGTVHIQRKEGTPTCRLRICNSNGHICYEHSSQGEEYRQLYALVRHKVLQMDEILDNMFADLASFDA